MSQSSQTFTAGRHAPVPFWRDVRVLRWLFQIAVLLIVGAIIALLARNLQESLRDLDMTLRFNFFTRRAGFRISEGPAFDSNSPMWQAFLVGIANTLRASVVGVVLATLLGTFVGIARLSRNWLLRNLALVYIEIMQNTPLLVQLFFWFVLVRALPRQRRGELFSIPPQPIDLGPVHIPQFAYFSQRGGALPGIEILDSFRLWWPYIILALIAAAIAWYVRVWMRERQGRPPVGQWLWALGALGIVLALGWVIVPGAPLRIEVPQLVGSELIVNYEGGWQITNNFQALILGLVLYTAAFIAEVVRAGIQAVAFGQIEAATSLGLTRGQQLRLIILPQAMRVIIPPLINQYLNLTKNSSLAIAVAYPDLFNISQTIGNQTGQNIQMVMIMMGSYLIMSLFISLLLNLINRRMQLVER